MRRFLLILLLLLAAPSWAITPGQLIGPLSALGVYPPNAAVDTSADTYRIFDPRDYPGWNGDGVTSDQAAWNAAITAATNDSSGRKPAVLVPPVTSLITAPLNLRQTGNRVSLIGANQHYSAIKMDAAFAGAPKAAVWIGGPTGEHEIKNFTVDCNSVASSIGLDVKDTRSASLDRIKVRGCGIGAQFNGVTYYNTLTMFWCATTDSCVEFQSAANQNYLMNSRLHPNVGGTCIDVQVGTHNSIIDVSCEQSGGLDYAVHLQAGADYTDIFNLRVEGGGTFTFGSPVVIESGSTYNVLLGPSQTTNNVDFVLDSSGGNTNTYPAHFPLTARVGATENTLGLIAPSTVDGGLSIDNRYADGSLHLEGGSSPTWTGGTNTISAEDPLVAHGSWGEGSAGGWGFVVMNDVPFSEDFTNWTNSNTTDTGGISDPFGGTSASRITQTALNGTIQYTITDYITDYSGDALYYAFWAKATTKHQAEVKISGGQTIASSFTPSTYWRKFFIGPTTISGTGNAAISIRPNAFGAGCDPSCDADDSVDIYGFQILRNNIGPYVKTNQTSGGAGTVSKVADDTVSGFTAENFITDGMVRAATGVGVGNAAANTNTPSGATAYAIEVFDMNGASLGYIPVYSATW